jgi:hypothetical protein
VLRVYYDTVKGFEKYVTIWFWHNKRFLNSISVLDSFSHLYKFNPCVKGRTPASSFSVSVRKREGISECSVLIICTLDCL